MNREELRAAEAAFIEGFRQASDKLGFLCLAHIPLELAAPAGPGLKLVEIVLADAFEVGKASPGFASRELVYHPLPGRLATSRTALTFRYVSMDGVTELSFAELLLRSGAEIPGETGHWFAQALGRTGS